MSNSSIQIGLYCFTAQAHVEVYYHFFGIKHDEVHAVIYVKKMNIVLESYSFELHNKFMKFHKSNSHSSMLVDQAYEPR